MNIQQDFKELLELLEKNKVSYMIIGGYAVAFHGYPRFTKDIDIYFEMTNDNVARIINSLVQFGFLREDLDSVLFATEGNVVTFGVEPIRVDFLNQIDGIKFSEAKKECVRGKYGSIDVFFMGKDDLIKNKLSTDRLRDKADVEEML